MSKFIDITGNRYNHLQVIEKHETLKGGIVVWKCLCDCGNYTYVRGKNLKNGAVKSCGCIMHNEPYNVTHNSSKTALYRRWQSMKSRCYNKNFPGYKNYGGRGIRVCDEWKNSFEKFRDWALSTMDNENLTLERIDNNGNYCPENCRWATIKEQANNRRSCLIFEYNGKKQNLLQWCNELKLDYKLVHNRLYKLHWSFEKAISSQ